MFIEQETVGCSALNVTSLSHLNVNLPQRFRDFGMGERMLIDRGNTCLNQNSVCQKWQCRCTHESTIAVRECIRLVQDQASKISSWKLGSGSWSPTSIRDSIGNMERKSQRVNLLQESGLWEFTYAPVDSPSLMHTQVVLKVFNGKEERRGEKLGKLDVGMGRNSYREMGMAWSKHFICMYE